MYHIKVETGETMFLPSVYYNKISPTSGCFIKASKEDAQGIVVNGTVYSINEKYPIEGVSKATLTYVTDWTEEITAEYEAKLCKEAQDRKIAEMSEACHNRINNGATVMLSNGSVEEFSYNLEDQINLDEIYNKILNGIKEYPYHSKQQNKKIYSSTDLILIYNTLFNLKTEQLIYFNQLRSYIKNLTTADEVNSVYYGQNLIGEYFETYNYLLSKTKNN